MEESKELVLGDIVVMKAKSFHHGSVIVVVKRIRLGSGRVRFKSPVCHEVHWITLGQSLSYLILPCKVEGCFATIQ